MSNDKPSADHAKQAWTKPDFKKLGTLRDIAGRAGTGLQSGPNSRAPNS